MTIPTDRRTSDGFILVLASGMLVLLAAAAFAFAGLARATGSIRSSLSSGLAERFTIEAGLEYAAARLSETATGRIQEPGPEDDWHYRAYDADDGSHFSDRDGPIPVEWLDPPLRTTLRPSYAHGEILADADGNGRRDVWSGRLRAGSTDGRFRLRIEPDAGSAVNLAVSPARAAFLAATLNQLGAVLGVSRFSVPLAADPSASLWWSDLGDRIVAGAPPAGFRALGDLRAFLSESEFRAVRRFLTVIPAPTRDAVTLEPAGNVETMDLNGAPPRLIEALLRFRMSGAANMKNTGIGFNGFPDRDLDGTDDTATILGTDPRTKRTYATSWHRLVIHPDEAFRIARLLRDTRREPGAIRSFTHLFRTLDTAKQECFPNPAADPMLDALDPSNPFPYFAEAVQNAKIDMIFQIFRGGRGALGGMPPVALATYDADRFVFHAGDPSRYPGPGRQRETLIANAFPGQISRPSPSQPYAFTNPIQAPSFIPYQWIPGFPTRFSIRSESGSGRHAGIERSVSIGGRLWLTTQEDFGNLSAYPAPWGGGEPRKSPRGITVEGTPGYPVDASGSRSVVTTPLFFRDVYRPDLPNTASYPSVPGCVTLGRKIHSHSLPGQYFNAGFPYMSATDLDTDEHLLAMVDGIRMRPARLPTGEPLRPAKDSELSDLLANDATPFSTTFVQGPQNSSGNHKRNLYAFSQHVPSGVLPEFPRLPLVSSPVPAPYLGDPVAGSSFSYSTGDFRAVTSLGISLACVGSDGDKQGQRTVLHLRTSGGPGSPSQVGPPGCYTDLVIERPRTGTAGTPNLKWRIQVVNGPITDEAGQGWNSIPVTDHTRTFEGTYTPPNGGGGSTTPLAARWLDPEIHHLTFFYYTREASGGDGMWPPDSGRIGLWVDDQLVIDESLAWAPGVPDAPGMKRAEMFFADRRPAGAEGLGEPRETLNLTFNQCTDIVFFDAAQAVSPDCGDLHDAYRRDFFCRTGGFTSARYVFPEPVVPDSINWGGVIPMSVLEGAGTGAMGLTVRFHDEAGGLASQTALSCERKLVGTPQEHALPAGGCLPRRRAKSFDFRIDFDCTNASPSGPLVDVPAVEEVIVNYRSRPSWTDPVGLDPAAVPGTGSGGPGSGGPGPGGPGADPQGH